MSIKRVSKKEKPSSVSTKSDKDSTKSNNSTKSPVTPAKEKPIPFYLLGKDGAEKKSGKVKDARTFHQKKKDSKTADALRLSDKVEKEWLEKFKKYSNKNNNNNDNNANDDEKKNNNDNNNNNITENDMDYDPMTLDICLRMLLTLDEAWEDRLVILGEMCKQLINASSDNEYGYKMCKFLCSIGVQWSDPRSLIAQGLEETLSNMVQKTAKRFIFFSPYVLESLYSPLAIRIEALRDAAIKFCQNMVYSCEPYDKDMGYILLYQLIDGLNSKHKGTTTVCAEMIYYYVSKMNNLEDKEDDLSKELLKELEKAVDGMTKHAAAETRMNGYRTLNLLEKGVAPKLAKLKLNKFTKAQNSKYDESLKNAKYHDKKK